MAEAAGWEWWLSLAANVGQLIELTVVASGAMWLRRRYSRRARELIAADRLHNGLPGLERQLGALSTEVRTVLAAPANERASGFKALGPSAQRISSEAHNLADSVGEFEAISEPLRALGNELANAKNPKGLERALGSALTCLRAARTGAGKLSPHPLVE